MSAPDKRITELDEATTVPTTAWFPFADTAIATMAPTGTDFKVSRANLVKGLLPSQAGQSGKVLSTDGTSLSWAVDASGGSVPSDLAYIDHANTFSVSPQTIVADDDAHKGLVVKAHSATQSASLQEWQGSDGTAKVFIGPDGELLVTSTSVAQITTDNGDAAGIFVLNPTAIDSAYLNSLIDYAGIEIEVVMNADDLVFTSLSSIHAGIQVKSTNSHDYSNVNGIAAEVDHFGTGTISSCAAMDAQVYLQGNGHIGSATGIYVYIDRFFGTGTIDTVYGINIDRQYHHIVNAEAYGLHIEDWSGGGSPVHFNVHSIGASSRNAFEGRVDVGRASVGDAAARLQVDSTTQGFLPPRMTTTQRDAIASPSEGLVLYNITTHKLTYRNASTWVEV